MEKKSGTPIFLLRTFCWMEWIQQEGEGLSFLCPPYDILLNLCMNTLRNRSKLEASFEKIFDGVDSRKVAVLIQRKIKF
jgi:hypothetical protein